MSSRDPAYLGYMTLGSSRIGVYTDRWERLFRSNGAYRSFTWRRVKYINTPDSDTGYIFPSYDEESINGILIERGGPMPNFAFGMTVQQDAVLFTVDPVGKRGTDEKTYPDQIKDNETVYEVKAVEKHSDPKRGGLAFYLIHLNKLALFAEE